MNVSALERPAKLVQSDHYIVFRRGLHMTQEVVTDSRRRFPELRAIVRENGFTEANNISNSDNGYYQIMPLNYDKTRILKHAVKIARRPNGNRAMTLGAATGIAHPYKDGTGRTVRFVHAINMGYSVQEIVDAGIITPHAVEECDSAARERIDLTPPSEFEPYLREVVYGKAGIEDNSFRPYFPEEEWGNIPSEYAPFAAQARKCYESSAVERGLEFGLDSLQAAGFDVPYEEAPDFLNLDRTVKLVNMQNLASRLGKRGVKTLLVKDESYRRYRGEAWVDCVSPNTSAGARQLTIAGQMMSAADHSIRFTNNLCKDGSVLRKNTNFAISTN